MMRRAAAILLAVFVTLSGCAERKARPGSESGSGTGITPSESISPPPIFPHTEGWKNAASHGTWVASYGHSSCLACHKVSSDRTETTPTCNSCHPLYPHTADWIKKENHGARVKTEGKGNCATQCHGVDLAGGLSGVSCTLCHTIYPHKTIWVAPGEHGKAAQTGGKPICKECHGDDLLGGPGGVSCRQCHTGYPHPVDWGSPALHGAQVKESGSASCATTCHGLDLEGGLSGVSCNACHNLYPHSGSWETEHASQTATLGKGACQGCHGADFKALLAGKNCFSCHDYPHPNPAVWTPFSGGHGEKVKTLGGTSSCEVCHGSDLATLKGGKNCFTCHPSYLHVKMPNGPWKNYEGHGQYSLPPVKKPECELCHGTNYQGGSRGNPSCFTASCHVSYPHLTGWRMPPGEPQGHGEYVNLNTTVTCATARCHGPSLVPIPGVTKGTSCSPGCHDTYPHPANWTPPVAPQSLHGPVAKADISKCKSCHGSGLDTSPPGSQSCVSCHPTYLSHDTAQMPGAPPGWWETFGGHGTDLQGKGWNEEECKACHGANYLGGISLVSCKQAGCHPSYPHNAAGWSGYSGHGYYVLSILGNNKTPCKICHDNTFTGGHSGVSCYSGGCHTTYPHTGGWLAPGNHGAAAYGTGKNSCKSANCHKSNFLGGAPAGPPAGPLMVPSCKGAACHADFPHNVASWVAGAASVHAATFIEKMDGDGVGDDATACQECHGAGYNRVVPAAPTINCTTCHPNGVTHKTGWAAGTGHGSYYAVTKSFDSTSEPFCKDCHGHPTLAVPFSDADTKGGLTAQSDCYGCHWAYPHIGFDLAGYDPGSPGVVDGDELWSFVDDGITWGPGDNLGHIYYLVGTPLFTDSGGHFPSHTNDPILIGPMPPAHAGETPALPYTCGGGTANNCHFNGFRTNPTSSTSNLCGNYCH